MIAFGRLLVAYLAEAIPHIVLTIFKNDFKPELSEEIGSATPVEQPLSTGALRG